MNNYRNALPQLEQGIFFTDGGMETTLIFQQHYDLPCFAAFPLLDREKGVKDLTRYYERYVSIALQAHCGFILESPTWRANSDWGDELGYSRQQISDFNQRAIALMEDIRSRYAQPGSPLVISGCIGPRGDGYKTSSAMSVPEAAQYHRLQIADFADTNADMVSAFTMTYAEEAIGITLAARDFALPVVISFTTETDGCLPNGQTLEQAIEQVERATDKGPAYYMINCAHPEHFRNALASGESWTRRIRGIRANASRMSHVELDEAEQLDDGDPRELGELYRQLQAEYPQFTILGGCCGTDHRHVEQVKHACC